MNNTDRQILDVALQILIKERDAVAIAIEFIEQMKPAAQGNVSNG